MTNESKGWAAQINPQPMFDILAKANAKEMSGHYVARMEIGDTPGFRNVEIEELGIQFLNELYKWPIWKQTSYNTHGGVHSSGGIPFRKNHAGIGYTYDEDRDAFIPKKPYNSWILNEQTCLWESPIPIPSDASIDKRYNWNETNLNWELVE
jgi:hypothetical protein